MFVYCDIQRHLCGGKEDGGGVDLVKYLWIPLEVGNSQ